MSTMDIMGTLGTKGTMDTHMHQSYVHQWHHGHSQAPIGHHRTFMDPYRTLTGSRIM